MTTHMVRQAIVTKFLPPTNFRGSRIKATAQAGSVTLLSNHGRNIEERHAFVAKALAEKFGWGGKWYQGGMPGDSGYCFVCLASRDDGEPAFKTVQKG